MTRGSWIPENGLLGFHRLAVMGLNESGMQPFVKDGSMVVCNGEIYGFRKRREELQKQGLSVCQRQ